MTSLAKVSIALWCALVLLVGGIWLGGHPETLPNPIRTALVDDDRALRAEIVDSVKDNFYKPVKESEIDESSLKGIVRGLDDRFSHYLTPKETKQFEESVRGSFEGVGMGVDEDRRGLRVLNVFDNSPAKRAGVRKGDFVTAVDGKSIAGVSSDVATARIKGPAGTPVRLEVADPDSGKRRTVRLRRARIDVPVVDGKIAQSGGKKLGVVELAAFSSGAHGLLRQEIDKLLAKDAQGLVLDLRGNGGGLLREAVLVSSIFIEDGLVTFTKGRTKPRREFEAEGEAIAGDIPVVVLVDRGSASASEIVTGALRDRKRATVVGQRTFGKGVFQEVQKLSNGGLLDLTVGEYFLPGGENIGKKGVTPTVKAKDDPKTDRDEGLPVALRALARQVSGR
ncbi:MAG: S41 family peptidase [Thermoleophilaceae bacterium]